MNRFLRRIEGLNFGFQGLYTGLEMIDVLFRTVLERTLGLGGGDHGTDTTIDHHLFVLLH